MKRRMLAVIAFAAICGVTIAATMSINPAASGKQSAVAAIDVYKDAN